MKKIQLFHTCIINEIYPEVAVAVVRILEHLDFEVAVPYRQTCCGQPAYNSGFHPEARRIAGHTIDLLHETEGPIIIPSGSCGDMILHGYRRLLAQDAAWLAKLDALRPRCFEFTQFLVDELGATDLGARLPGRAAYHPGCHLLRGLGISEQPRLLLQRVAGLELLDFQDQNECCGFGGLFAVDNPGISAKMMHNKLGHLGQTGVDLLIGCDMGCLMHLQGGLRRSGAEVQVRHVAQVLAQGLGL